MREWTNPSFDKCIWSIESNQFHHASSFCHLRSNTFICCQCIDTVKSTAFIICICFVRSQFLDQLTSFLRNVNAIFHFTFDRFKFPNGINFHSAQCNLDILMKFCISIHILAQTAFNALAPDSEWQNKKIDLPNERIHSGVMSIRVLE